MILFTQVSKNIQQTDSFIGRFSECQSGSQIMSINPDQLDESPQNLTENFFSASSPEVSYDGKFMLFTAQKEQTGSWQIWEMNLENLKVQQITLFTENCISPVYLPGGRFACSKIVSNDTIRAGYSLFTGNLDGTDIHQISFNPHTYSGLSVLQDGRILAISQQDYPEIKDGILMVLRPDGTKQEMFYQGLTGSKLSSEATETDEGKIIFIESEKSNRTDGNIISINYNRPLNSRSNLTSELEGNFYNVRSFQDGKLLTVYNPKGENHSALYEFKPENKTLSLIYKNENFNLLDAVFVAKHERPRKLPSEVNSGVKTGLLLCQDINFLGIENSVKSLSTAPAEKIEVMGLDSTLGVVNVEKDGSVYIKILADTPFRLRTLNADGQVVNGPGSWIYLRPNERRGCVGCHAGNEQSPFNRHPLSVKKNPVLIPEYIKGISEHKVSLE